MPEPKKKTYAFQTEIPELLDLMVHSLYSNKEIFLRELISNAADAIDKLKFAALSNPKLANADAKISVMTDKSAGTITVRDNGIGMRADEVVENIGTIANSGTKKFLAGLDKNQIQDSHLIGQFGVGFYSAFIVAERVVLKTKRADDNSKNGTQWSSDGKGEYTLEKIPLRDAGTSVTLFLKKSEHEFLEDYRLRGIIEKYSDHITAPIMMRKLGDKNDEKDDKKDDKKNETEMVNKGRAFWAQDKKTLKAKDYEEFYKSLSYDFEPPLLHMHNQVEGNLEYTSLLFIPKKAPFDLWEPKRRGGVKLYARRVFIMDDNENLMPLYLRFIKGVIDTADLPLNISREILQSNKIVDKIRKANVKRILSELEKMAKKQPEKYAEFWREFGMVMKEGVVEDFANKEKIANLLRFATTKSENGEQKIALEDYKKRMKSDQKAIYYLTAESYDAAKNSPHLEIFKQKNIEVLLLSDRVDEWLVGNFTEFEGVPLKSAAKGDLADLESGADKKAKAEVAKDFETVIQKMADILKDQVQMVKISTRLSDSPSCLVADENAMGGNMERIMKSLGQKIQTTKPILEINPEHPLVRRLKKKIDEDLVYILFDQALLSEGGKLAKPAEFVRRINQFMLR